MMKASGLGFNQLSTRLANLSLKLIWQHPERYLVSVLDGWQLFWRAPVYWRPEVVASESLRSALRIVVLAERAVLVTANLVFLASSALTVVWRRWRSRLGMTPMVGIFDPHCVADLAAPVPAGSRRQPALSGTAAKLGGRLGAVGRVALVNRPSIQLAENR